MGNGRNKDCRERNKHIDYASSQNMALLHAEHPVHHLTHRKRSMHTQVNEQVDPISE
jgi:hypothetical protein